ncbi:MAG TPA: hypothetical protein VFV93_01730, partial [Thermomicrobiales bacterium]|nr:hypothetical protein [Thermomicrobiales bacterium]
MRPGVFPVGLAVVVGLAAMLRFWSIDFGLPLVTHPDEPLIVDAADQMISGRTLNPGWFRYPALIIDIEAALLSVIYAIDTLVGLSTDTIRSLGYGGGRIVMAGFGVATVALTGLLGRKLARLSLVVDRDDRSPSYDWLADIAGLVAAGMLAVSFIHVKDSHYLKPDIPTGFFTTLTLWFALGAWEKPLPQPAPLRREGALDFVRRRAPSLLRGAGWGRGLVTPWLLAGIAVGLAAATKYTGAVVAIVPAMTLVLAWRSDGGMTLRQAAWIAVWMGLAAITVFLLVNPYILLAPREFLSPVDGIRAEFVHYRTGHDGAEGNDSWRWYLAEIWHHGFGPTLTPLIPLGALLAIQRLVADRRAARNGRSGTSALWLVLIFIPLYYAIIARYPVRFDRQLIPILPYLALLGGFGVAATLALLARWPADRRGRQTATMTIC